ncbi:MAG: response regulator transcription factor [Bacteroidia bacterium]
MKILVIEDEKALSDSIIEYLKQEGYLCESAFDFNSAYNKVGEYDYDCILVDITLPGGNGLDIIKKIKKRRSSAGIIVISAKNSLDDTLLGLELGADDYISKPFYLSELNARIKSLLRRKNFEGEKEVILNEITLIPDMQMISVNNQQLDLTKKEFDLLMYFITNKNRVLTKDAIAEHLWGDNIDNADSFDFIYTHIKNLRKKLIEKGSKDYIKTVYGMGYKFSLE